MEERLNNQNSKRVHKDERKNGKNEYWIDKIDKQGERHFF
jgi:hypothetical protein